MMRVLSSAFLFLSALVTFCDAAQAQSVATKVLCEGAPGNGNCNTTSTAKIGDPVYYQFVVSNGGSANTLSLTEDIPASFVPANPSSPIICTVTDGPNIGASVPVTITNLGPPVNFDVQLTAGQIATCTLAGHFNVPGVGASNTVSMAGSQDSETTFISQTTELPVDLEIEKSVVAPTSRLINLSGGPQRVKYRIEVETDKAIYLGSYFRVYDRLAIYSSGIPIDAAMVAGSTQCFVTPGATSGSVCTLISQNGGLVQATGGQDFAAWGFVPASSLLLSPGETLTIEYEVEYSVPATADCIKEPDSDGIKNRAFLGLAGSNSALNDDSDGNNDTGWNSDASVDIQTGIYYIDKQCGAGAPPGPPPVASTLELKKAIDQTGPNATAGWTPQWGAPVRYEIKMANGSKSTKIYDIRVEDVVQNLVGTPNFEAQLIRANWLYCPTGSTCVQIDPAPPTNASNTGPEKSFLSYYDNHKMWEGKADDLRQREIRLELYIVYSRPYCDTAELIGPKKIRNRVNVRHKMATANPLPGQPGNTEHLVSAFVDVDMPAPPACRVSAEKKALGTQTSGQNFPPDKIIFDEWMRYEVEYSALPPVTNGVNEPIRIGTLIDALRIANPYYAYGLDVDYNWQCSDSGIGGAAVRDYQTSGNGTATVGYVGKPHQGTRIMDHPGFVEFEPGAKLTCQIAVRVKKPDPTDPYCFSDGDPRFENLALLDQSLYLNSNGPWPMAPKGKTWDNVSSSLPKCYNIIVNKNASPGEVGPNGGPITYTISITNGNLTGTNGDINFPVGSPTQGTGPFFVDKFITSPPNSTLPNNQAALSSGNPCQPANQHPCDILQSNGGNTITAITQLSAGDTISYSYTVAGSYDPHQICNDFRGEMIRSRQTYHREWYPKNVATWQSDTCTQIRASLEIEKIISAPSWITLAGGTPFSIEVECNSPSPFNDVKQTLGVSPSNPAAVMRGIYVGSECEIDEVDLPDADHWGDCEWADPAYPDGQTILADGSVEPHKLRVVNQLKCKSPPTTLDITKTLNDDADCVEDGALCTFRITVTNTGPNPYAGDVDVSDVFTNSSAPPIYYLGPVNPHNWDWSCTQQNSNGPIECEENYLELAVGESAYFDVTLDLPEAGTNCATLETPDQSPKPESCVVVGTSVADLSIVKTKTSPGDCHTSLVPNGLAQASHCKFKFVITNNGTTTYQGPVTVSDRVNGGGGVAPVGIIYSDAGWTCMQANPGVHCTNPSVSIAPGDSIDFEIILDVQLGLPPERNCASIKSPKPPNNAPPINSCVTIYDFGTGNVGGNSGDIQDLDIQKNKITSGSCHGAIVQGQPNPNHCEFEIVITNNGTNDHSGPITVTDTVTPAFNISVVSHSPGWSCQVSGGVTTCTSAANTNIPAGTSITLDLVLNIDAPLPAEKNCAAIGAVDANGEGIESCVGIGAVLPTPSANLSIEKSQRTPGICGRQANPSGDCEFSITVTNNGSTDYNGPFAILDTLTPLGSLAQLVSVVSNSSGWTCVINSGLTQCTNSDPNFNIPAGGSITLDLTLKLVGPALFTKNCAKIGIPAGITDESCIDLQNVPSAASNLSLKKTKVTSTPCLLGAQSCSFRIAITNDGSTSYNGILTFEDEFILTSGSPPSVQSPGWTCPSTGNIFRCTSDQPVQIPAGNTLTVDLVFNYNGSFSARKNCARLIGQSPSGVGPDSCVGIRDMRILKELISADDCTRTGNRHCTFRITIENAAHGGHTGPVTISDLVDFGGQPQNTPIVGTAPGNGWSCQPGSGNTGVDCTHPGPAFTYGNGTSSFEITLDMSGFPPVHIGNCAKLTQPALTPQPYSCVQLGPIWEPPFLRILTKKEQKEEKKRRKKALKQWHKETGKKKKGGFKFPKIRVNIGVGGGLGGGRRRRGEDRGETQPRGNEDGGANRDAAGNLIN